MRARYYDPLIGRFASEDLARHGHNWWSYCSANPINLRDATGNEGDLVETQTSMSLGALISSNLFGVMALVRLALGFITGFGTKAVMDFYLTGRVDVGGCFVAGGMTALGAWLTGGISKIVEALLGPAALSGVGGAVARIEGEQVEIEGVMELTAESESAGPVGTLRGY